MKIKDLSVWPPTLWSPPPVTAVGDSFSVSSEWRASTQVVRGAHFRLRVTANGREHAGAWLIQCNPPFTAARVQATLEQSRGMTLGAIGDLEISPSDRRAREATGP